MHATQGFKSAEAYLVTAMAKKLKERPHVAAGEEFTISDLLDPVLDNDVAIAAIQAAIDDGVDHGHRMFREAFCGQKEIQRELELLKQKDE